MHSSEGHESESRRIQCSTQHILAMSCHAIANKRNQRPCQSDPCCLRFSCDEGLVINTLYSRQYTYFEVEDYQPCKYNDAEDQASYFHFFLILRIVYQKSCDQHREAFATLNQVLKQKIHPFD